ncbi:MAG: C1 family peptidase [Candidatus Dormibacteria bacterium]
MTTARYGWIRDLPDHRDMHYAPRLATMGPLPERVDLRPHCPPVYDQGDLGSCTANALAGVIEYDEIRALQQVTWTPSRLFIYYNERRLEGTVESDSGAQLRDGIKVVAKVGVCPEADWPYDVTRFAAAPPAAIYREALRDRVNNYMRLGQVLTQLRTCLVEGFPFVFGFSVFASMESEAVQSSGRVPLPQPGDSMLGGHAVACVGYDNHQASFIFRNSWGSDWGDDGYGHIPYAYLLDPGLAADFWTVRSAPGAGGRTDRKGIEHSASERVED